MANSGIQSLETSRSRRAELQRNEGRGTQLSVLPDDVLTNIISFLPLKQAIRASTASSRLKQSWLFSRNLCFGKDFVRRHDKEDFVRIVDRVFALHLGSKIQTFRLVFDPTEVEVTVENWIQICIDKEVEELDLDFGLAVTPYRIASDFEDVNTIKILKLCCCELELLPTFRGLNSLTTLIFRRIEISAESLGTLFSYCLLLESVELVKCRRIGHLRILAQNLTRFKALKVGDCTSLTQIDVDSPTINSIYYMGRLISFEFPSIPQLKDIILNFKPRRAINKFFRDGSYLSDITHVPVISTSTTLIEDLSPGLNVEGALQLSFVNLRELQLFMAGAMYCNLYDIAHFLKRCPRLEKLFIDLRGFNFETQEVWELHQRELIERDIHLLRNLEYVKMEGFKCEEHEMEVVKFLLERAIVLETLVLVAPKTHTQGILQFHNIPICRQICKKSISPFVKTRFYFDDKDDTPGPKHSRTWYYQRRSSN
ncbi:hypothetical protein CCACVL1_15572 [Corchorus capsularis]|uniref:F-box domain-containing protein n=1 Tax=Corchorus capsularis TaxID=210143 RepID=A0A1R3I1U2_COCAP|nr:hypothetical protein CCACVL1_15572 [Corchorus capsularis]